MNNPSRKVTTPPSQKSVRNGHKGGKKKVNKLRNQQSSGRHWFATLLAIAILLSSATVIAGFAWLSFMYIFKPHQVTWINQVLPTWAQVPWQGERPQTMIEIRKQLQTQGETAGKLIALGTEKEGKFLLPIYTKTSSCSGDCQEITELRVYQISNDAEFKSQPEKYYYLISQTGIAGPEEAFVVAPLANATNENPGANINLPLTAVERFAPQSAPPGFWFYLHGLRQDGVHQISYGQVFYYTKDRDRLQQLLTWTSPRGQIPQWSEITGGGMKELVVNQSVGLEPQIRVYQVKTAKSSTQPTELVEIRLNPALWRNKAFADALKVARSGLWSPADKWLQFIQTKKGQKIPPSAQAQIAVVSLHAQQAKTQADRNWASPGQEVLADLIDGRWTQALEVLATSGANASEISRLLKADGGRLWSRVETALGINPKRSEVQIWGALILASQTNEKRAIAWLQSQSHVTRQTREDVQTWFKRLRGEAIAGTLTTSISPHSSRIIGSVRGISQINSGDWLNFDRNINLRVSNATQWYTIDVSAFSKPQGWLYAPFTGLKLPSKVPEKFLTAQLGLDTNATIQIATWNSDGQQDAIAATIRAAQLRNGRLKLLAVTDGVNVNTINRPGQSQPLAVSPGALEWLQSAPMTVLDLITANRQQAQTILSTLWRELQTSKQVKPGKIPPLEQISQKIGYWPIQTIDITGNQQPETILTISPTAIKALNPAPQPSQTAPQTLIISDQGKIIYSDFPTRQKHQNLTAIATLGGTNQYVLLVEGNNGYSLKRWSQTNLRFE